MFNEQLLLTKGNNAKHSGITTTAAERGGREGGREESACFHGLSLCRGRQQLWDHSTDNPPLNKLRGQFHALETESRTVLAYSHFCENFMNKDVSHVLVVLRKQPNLYVSLSPRYIIK